MFTLLYPQPVLMKLMFMDEDVEARTCRAPGRRPFSLAVVDLHSTVLVPAFWGESIVHSLLSQLAA